MPDFTLMQETFRSVFSDSLFPAMRPETIIQSGSDNYYGQSLQKRWTAPLKDVLTPERIDAVRERARLSVEAANLKLQKACNPHFDENECYSPSSIPVEDWILSVSAGLSALPFDVGGRLNLWVSVYPKADGSLLFMTEEYNLTFSDYLEKVLESCRDCLTENVEGLYGNLFEKVDIENYAESECYTLKTLPLSHAHDAVRQFTIFPSSIPEKLHFR